MFFFEPVRFFLFNYTSKRFRCQWEISKKRLFSMILQQRSNRLPPRKSEKIRPQTSPRAQKFPLCAPSGRTSAASRNQSAAGRKKHWKEIPSSPPQTCPIVCSGRGKVPSISLSSAIFRNNGLQQRLRHSGQTAPASEKIAPAGSSCGG